MVVADPISHLVAHLVLAHLVAHSVAFSDAVADMVAVAGSPLQHTIPCSHWLFKYSFKAVPLGTVEFFCWYDLFLELALDSTTKSGNKDVDDVASTVGTPPAARTVHTQSAVDISGGGSKTSTASLLMKSFSRSKSSTPVPRFAFLPIKMWVFFLASYKYSGMF